MVSRAFKRYSFVAYVTHSTQIAPIETSSTQRVATAFLSFKHSMPVSTRRAIALSVGTVRSSSSSISTSSSVLVTDVHAAGIQKSTRRETNLKLAKTVTEELDPAPETPQRKRVKVEPEEPSRALITPSPVSRTLSSVKTEKPSSFSKKSPSPSTRPPKDWEDLYSLVVELRQDRTAPCDHSGCEALPDQSRSPKDVRFQVLISLMLSSQTKDAVVAEAIRSMQRDGVLSVDGLSKLPAPELTVYIKSVGFLNNKTKYIKQSVEILKEKFESDIPQTAQEMMTLPGVGPKMAYICESVAWNTQSGIGVDTHMHRIFNQLRWVQSKNPEQTRVQLQAWLPHEKWGEVNLLWVGFGQEVQQFKPKILRKALDCSRPAEALKLLKRCGLDVVKEGKKLGIEDEIKGVTQKK